MLPNEDWLEQAKRLPVGMRVRVRHGRERTAAMTIANEGDRWWAYCQRCKAGSKVLKDYVRLTECAPADSANLQLPGDIRELSFPQDLQVAHFIAKKGLDLVMLPGVKYSPSRKRLMVPSPQGWMGRDVTEKSPQKWLTYNRQQFLAYPRQGPRRGSTAVLVEDAFSWAKVAYSLHSQPQMHSICALGTDASDSLRLFLMQFERVIIMFDGDCAGECGSRRVRRKLMLTHDREVGVCRVPTGKDPKDLSIQEIRGLLLETEWPIL